MVVATHNYHLSPPRSHTYNLRAMAHDYLSNIPMTSDSQHHPPRIGYHGKLTLQLIPHPQNTMHLPLAAATPQRISKKRFFHKKSSKNCPSGGAGDILFRNRVRNALRVGVVFWSNVCGRFLSRSRYLTRRAVFDQTFVKSLVKSLRVRNTLLGGWRYTFPYYTRLTQKSCGNQCNLVVS